MLRCYDNSGKLTNDDDLPRAELAGIDRLEAPEHGIEGNPKPRGNVLSAFATTTRRDGPDTTAY